MYLKCEFSTGVLQPTAFSNMAARLVAPGERDEEGGQRETG